VGDEKNGPGNKSGPWVGKNAAERRREPKEGMEEEKQRAGSRENGSGSCGGSGSSKKRGTQIVAQLKKLEVRKTAEDRCRSAEWETRGGPDTGRTRDGRWGFARNQSGGKDGLSAAKSDWVSRSQSAWYSVVCSRVRLVDANRSCVGSASEARDGKSGAEKDRSMREIHGRQGSGAEGQGKCRRGSEGGRRCE